MGYSACHWCHVMARESFSDPATARLINEWFVPVKVDREERPDVDRLYMDAVTALTGRGGWPLTAFLTPDGAPFFGGTYFPREARHGLPAFGSVLTAVHDAWGERRAEVAAAGADLTRRLAAPLAPADEAPGAGALRAVYHALELSFDPVHGGFGGPPKFPQAASLEFLLRVAGADWAPQAASMVHRTLTAMADGGIHDQVSGGFSRYAVDERWLVPHFEKMLYDNALLARLYARAAQVTGEPRFTAVARATLDYLLDDLSLPGGGFASAEDADSEGEEGRFYTFTWDEFATAAGPGAAPAAAVLGVTREGNFDGRNIVHRARSAAQVAAAAGVSPAAVDAAVAAALARCGPCGPAGCAPPATTRRWPPGTAWPFGPWPRPGPCWARRVTWRRRGPRPVSSWPSCAAPTDACSAPGEKGAARWRVSATTTPPWPWASWPCSGPTATRPGSPPPPAW